MSTNNSTLKSNENLFSCNNDGLTVRGDMVLTTSYIPTTSNTNPRLNVYTTKEELKFTKELVGWNSQRDDIHILVVRDSNGKTKDVYLVGNHKEDEYLNFGVNLSNYIGVEWDTWDVSTPVLSLVDGLLTVTFKTTNTFEKIKL